MVGCCAPNMLPVPPNVVGLEPNSDVPPVFPNSDGAEVCVFDPNNDGVVVLAD